MKLYKSNINAFNCVKVNNSLFFRIDNPANTKYVPAICPHRGGPLHYGYIDHLSNALVCPWHEGKYKICNLENKGIASIKIRSSVTLLVNDKDTIEVWTERRLLAGEVCNA